MFGENTYVVWDDTRECVIIDCGAFYPEEHAAIEKLIKSESLKPVHLLCTHGHIDHVMGNGFVSQTYGIKPEIHAGDEYLITNLREQARSMVGMDYADYIPPVGKYLSETDVISFGSHTLEIIHTPGHTPGGIVFHCKEEKVAFTGDTLFNMSVGRTDFPGGSWMQLMDSLKRMKNRLAPETALYSGHGNQTTMEYEMKWNPYLKN
jgi:glyoxylase-like metal-dependent hydrolase (beta-lactamase superfamily II)